MPSVRFGARRRAAATSTLSRARAATSIALVGANGSGKTTLLRLLHGLVDAHRRARASASRRAVAGDGVPAAVPAAPVGLEQPAARALAGARACRAAERAAARRRGAAARRPGRARATGRRACCRAASSSASRWRAPGRCGPTCCSSTSRPRTSTRRPSRRSRRCSHGFAAEGMTLVMSTHNLGQAKRLATRVVYLEGGASDRRSADRAVLRRPSCRRARPLVPQRRVAMDTGMSCARAPHRGCWLVGLLPASAPRRRRAGALHRDGVDHQHRAVGPVRRTCCRRSRRPPASTCAWSRVGTGQALDMGRRGDADVLFVHDQAAEEKFVAEGFGAEALAGHVQRLRARRPAGRPGRREGQGHRRGAAASSRRRTPRFVSRGDKSGTHAAELRYWKAAGIDAPDAKDAARPFDYKECGCGMGPALNIGVVERRLRADRPRHLAHLQEPRRPRDPGRGRQAPVQPVRRDRRQPGQASAREERRWRRRSPTGSCRPTGQATIAAYKVGGEQLFFPNANRDGSGNGRDGAWLSATGRVIRMA